jgi:hypothetical protein
VLQTLRRRLQGKREGGFALIERHRRLVRGGQVRLRDLLLHQGRRERGDQLREWHHLHGYGYGYGYGCGLGHLRLQVVTVR